VGFSDEPTADVVTDNDDDDDSSISSYDSTSSSSSSSSSYSSLMDSISDVTWGSASFSWSVGSKKSIVSLLPSRWGATNCPHTPTTTASSTADQSSSKDLTVTVISDQVKPPQQPCRRGSSGHPILVQEKECDQTHQPTCLCPAFSEPSLALTTMNAESDIDRALNNSMAPRQPCRRGSNRYQTMVQEKECDQTQPACLCPAVSEPSLSPTIMNAESDIDRSRNNSMDLIEPWHCQEPSRALRGVNATTTSIFDVNQAKERIYDLYFI
jgi:hypothetical protein